MSLSDGVTATAKLLSVIDVQANTAPTLSERDDVQATQSNMQQHPINDKISFRHWSAHRVKKFVVIWLDPNIDELNSDYQNSINQLRQIVSSTKVFTDIEQCVDFIIEIEDANFFLILSDTIGEIVMPLIHDAPQLDSIYVFCANNTKHEQWVSEWKKIEGVFSDILSICDQLQRNIKYSEQDIILANTIWTSSSVYSNEPDQSFMYSQLLTEILLEMNYEKAAKTEFIELCRKQYQANKVQLHRIDGLERDYELHSALWWYMKESFIVSMLASALRTQNIALIIKMGFYIKDLHQQIKQIHSTPDKGKTMITYRGQVMANAEFENLKGNIGCLIAFNSFLSTTTNSVEAVLYAERAQTDPQLTGIIFQMEINSSISTIPFVSLSDVIDIPFCENEILFSMHTVFRIDAIEQVTESLWSVSLTLTSDTDDQLQRLAESLRKEIDGPNPLHRLGNLLIKMGELDKAEEIFKTLLETTSNVDLEQVVSFYNQFGYICKEKGNFSSALVSHQKALEIQQKSLPSNHPLLAITYNNIGQVHYAMGDYSTALSHHQKAFEIQQTSLPSSHPDLAATHSNIGRVYDSMGNYSTALSHLQKTLEIQEKGLLPNHPDLATTYENIGRVYHAMGEYSIALSHHQTALEIRQKSLLPDHPLLAITYNNIGRVHHAMREYSTALSHYQKALEIQHKSLPSSHPDLAMTYNNIGEIYVGMIDYINAISYYKKTLKIQQVALPSDHPSLAITCNNIGRVHELRENYSDALYYYEKAIKIQQKALPSNHPSLSTTCNSIGEMYRLTGDYSSALSYYEDTLKIRTKSLSPNHPSLAETHHHIAMVLEGLHRYDKAVEHASFALNIARHSFEPNEDQLKNYQQHLDEILLPECSQLAKTKIIDEWTYPFLLVFHSLHQSRLHSILYGLTDGHLMPPSLSYECLTKLESNKQVKNIVFEILTDSIYERDRLLTEFSSVNHIESIYLLGKPPETSEQRYKFFTNFHKVSIFCEDEEELAVRWALDTGNELRRLGGQYAEANDIDSARQYFQRGKVLYERLAELIDQTRPKVS